MANNLSGISYTNNFNNLDGLSIVQADELFVDGTSIDPTNLVPYTGATQTTDLGSQNIKTSRVPTANSDLTNKFYVDGAVSVGSGDTLGIVNLNFVRYSGSISDTDLGTYKISSSAVPTTANHLTNKTYVDGAITTATSNKVPYTGATSNVVLTGTNKFQQSYNATISDTTTVVNRQTLDSAIAGLGAGILNLNNTWGYGNTNDMNGAFASIQPQIANQTNLATGGSDFIGTMPICVLTKPSTYYNLGGAGSLGMSVGLDLGYTGASFTAGASTTITGSWTANTVSSRIATITFDVSSHIGKSLNCVWEGLTPLVFATSPPPFFTVVNGSTTVYSSPQPISGTNTYVWNFTPTVGTTTITYTVQSTGTPSLPAFSWTRFSIKQIGASYLAYKPGAKYTATFTNLLGSQNMSFYVYQYNIFGGSGVPIGDIFAIPITTSGQTITITFTPNSLGNTGPIIFFFQPSSANQYVRFDSAIMTRADMTVAGNIQSALGVNNTIASSNPTGNSGNGVILNMSALNGAFGSLECYNNTNTAKLPIALNAYGGNVGVGRTDPSYKLDVNGEINTIGGYYISNASPATNGYLRIITSGGVNYIQSGLTATSDSKTDLVFGSMYAGSQWAKIQTNGNFLIGSKSTADQKLDVSGDGARIQVESTTANNAVVQIKTGANTSYMFTEQNGNLRIYPGNTNKALWLQGVATINNGESYAVSNNYMATGSLTIGDPRYNYGGGTSYWNSNTAGLLMECLDNTEIAVHDAGNRVASLMFYSGNNIFLGRDMGWGLANTYILGNFYCANGASINNTPENDNRWAHVYVRGLNSDMRRSQCVAHQVVVYASNSWAGGTNLVNAFYRYNGITSQMIIGRVSYYVSGPTMAYPTIRIYSQSTGQFWYFQTNNYTNNGGNHITVPIYAIFNTLYTTATGWFDIYVYNGANCITDTNDILDIHVITTPVAEY